MLNPSGPATCDRCGVIVRAMGHVCDPDVRAQFLEQQRQEGLAIGASGVADDEAAGTWEEAIARLVHSHAAVSGGVGVAPAPQPRKHFGLSFFQWRILWAVLNWSALFMLAGFLLGRYSR